MADDRARDSLNVLYKTPCWRYRRARITDVSYCLSPMSATATAYRRSPLFAIIAEVGYQLVSPMSAIIADVGARLVSLMSALG
jgi:hypothetical protein